MAKGDTRQYLQPEAYGLIEGFDRTLTYEDFDEYQQWMSKKLETSEAILLGAFMGSGKTATTLHAFWKLWKSGKVKKGLIIAPLNVAKDTWPDEIMVWDFSRELHYAVIVGDEGTRLKALEEDADLFIVNRENLKWLYQTKGALWFKQFGILIYDEASRLKGADKKTKKGKPRKDGTVKPRSRSEFGYVAQVRRLIPQVWQLSGTPSSNGLIDLWGPGYILDFGERLGNSLTAFRERWFQYDQYKRTWAPFMHSENEIMDKLKDIMFVLREEDYLKLPPLKVYDRYVNLDPKHMQRYREFQRTLALEEYDVEAVNKGVLSNKLLQFANGSIYSDADMDDPDWTPTTPPKANYIHDRKLEELGSIFEEANGAPVLIAYTFKFDVHAIKKKYPWVRVYGETPNDLKDWNQGKLKAMILHPASAGHGLNFQHGSNIAVWYGLNWSLELYQQFNKRLHRRGQKGECVKLYRILARGTHDDWVAETLENKAATQDQIVEHVRVSMEHIRKDLKRMAS